MFLKNNQKFDFIFKFISTHVPFIGSENSPPNCTSNYFCIYQNFFFDDHFFVYQIDPFNITTIELNDNKVSTTRHESESKIKPIVTVDKKNNILYYISIKGKKQYIISNQESSYLVNLSDHNIHSSIISCNLLVYDSNIFVVTDKQVFMYNHTDKNIVRDFGTINSSELITKNEVVYLILLIDNCIILFDIKKFSKDSQPDYYFKFSTENNFSNALFYCCEDNLYFFSPSDNENRVFKIRVQSSDKKEPVEIFQQKKMRAFQELNKILIDRCSIPEYGQVDQYDELLELTSGAYSCDEKYEGDFLFFGPSFYFPLKKSQNSLYCKLNEIKKTILFKNEEFSHDLISYSKSNDDVVVINEKVKKILDENDIKKEFDWSEELDYLLETIKLPENLKEESIVPSSKIQLFFDYVIAEIINTFLNLLIIKALEGPENGNIDDPLKIYSTLFKIINSELVMKNDKIDSSLFLLNLSFSPSSILKQIAFIYKGELTFSELSSDDIFLFHSICPEPVVEKRILDVARAYMDKNEFDKCVENLEIADKLASDKNASLPNIYITSLLKKIPNDDEKQYQLLKTLNRRLPENMYKSLYLISLRVNKFAEAVDLFYSEDALSKLVNEVKKDTKMFDLHSQQIKAILQEKELNELIKKIGQKK